MAKRFAHVVTGLPLDKHFDYAVPENLQKDIAVGSRVKIPFGNTRRIGFVINLTEKSRIPRLKKVQQLMDTYPSLDDQLLRWTKRISEYYGCSWGEAIDTALPSSLRKGRKINLGSLKGEQAHAGETTTTLIHEKGIEAARAEVFRRMDETLTDDKQVIVLVPEVSWIHPTIAHVKDQFDEPVAILDKRMKTSEELEEWLKIKQGEVRIAVGTRSCVFAPFSRLGLIVMFDEADMSYKQEQSPHYHAREVARFRQETDGCDVMLVSHCPSTNLWYAAQNGEIAKKVCGEDAPSRVQMVDMTNYKIKRGTFISPPLENEIRRALDEDKKVMLFLNRKGEAVQKLESEVHRRFPRALVCHFDKENREVAPGANFIIATQAIFSILHKVQPSLISVVRLDSELSWNDYRASHRAFSLLVYLNRFVREKVIAQSYNLDNYAIHAAMKMDFEAFYTEEIKLRRELDYPPFKHLVSISFRGPKESTVQRKMDHYHEILQDAITGDMEIVEPHPDLYEQLKNAYRLTIIIKSKNVEQAVAIAKKAKAKAKVTGGIIITIDVD